ncbi:MAG: glycerol uptake facilitator protein [Gaiellaceae bacterium]|jgi:glycerol uptake facilitator protein|nr:glycerol uptake facilitator protein [Gaiellaceae bacterium]
MEQYSAAQRALAEFIGTALLVFVGAGSVPAILLLEGGTKAPFSGADLGFISMAFGLIVVAMVYTIGKVSGCHINPAVTFALAVTKRLPWSDVPLYWGSQIAGGIAGAFAMWGSFGTRAVDLGYGFGVVHFDHTVTSWGSAMLIEGIGTAILLFTIMGIVDTRSPEGWAGLVIGLVIVAIIITVGPITNASLNPARAIGPLFVTTIHGGVHNWTQQFLAYVPANLVGAAVAVFAYDWLAHPRKIARPIKEAVTEPDRAEFAATTN